MAKKKFYKSPWVISIGTTVFSLFLTIIYDYSKEKPVLSTIGDIFITIWKFILAVLNFHVRIWWLLIAFFVFVGFIYMYERFKKQ